MRARPAEASRLEEFAPAKINLTLKVLGRRPDGYHELRSLVVFAAVGDRLALEPGRRLALDTSGDFCAGLETGSDNLVLRAAGAFRERFPAALLGRFDLHKNLPVASGIGGGSADAAAALRLLDRANPGVAGGEVLSAIALGLGSDIPACLLSRAGLMEGRGESFRPLEGLPKAALVLVNPGVPLSSRDVFARSGAPPLAQMSPAPASLPAFSTLEELVDHVRAGGNDLLPAASRLAPVIPEIIGQIAARPGCLAASMSGSGATCFGLFAAMDEAGAAAAAIRQAHPGWWAAHAGLR